MDRDPLIRYALGAGIAVVFASVGLLARGLLGRPWRGPAGAAARFSDCFREALGPHLPLLLVSLGIVLGARYVELDAPVLALVDRAAYAVLLIGMTLVASSFASRLFTAYAEPSMGALAATTLMRNVVRFGVLGLGLLVVLGSFGIEITPLLTALGVGSLAVALALQPTLSNLIAGFHVTLARRIRVGDFVELESGQQGTVVDIGWRSVQLRELANNLVLVPNAKLAEVIVRNYSLPETEQAALVQVGVSYDSDLPSVERVTVDTARGVQAEVEGAVQGFEPFVRFHTFGDSSIDFTVILRVHTFADRYRVTHEFIKRLHQRYRAERIEIPYPQRVLHWKEAAIPSA